MKTILLAALILFATSPALARTSGYWTSVNEMSAILDSKDVADELATSDRIRSVTMTGVSGPTVSYAVSAMTADGEICTVAVWIEYDWSASTPSAGPGKMKISVDPRICVQPE